MGNSASKAARTLPRNVTTPKPAALKVESTRMTQADAAKASQNERPDGHDPDDLLSRLSKIGPVQLTEAETKYQPASDDALIQTLEHRARVQAADAESRAQKGAKTTLPVQTITAILQSLQAGDSKETVARSYNTTTETLDKFKALSIPPMKVGRRR